MARRDHEDAGPPEGAEVRVLNEPACSAVEEHRGEPAWKSRDGRVWTCARCYGNPFDVGDVVWGRFRG